MEIYKIKRFIKNNEMVSKIFKTIYMPVRFIKNLPENLREYKIVNKRLLEINEKSKKVLYVGIPLHANIGDQAQYFCIQKWLKENFDEYEVIEYPDCLVNSNFFNINSKIKKIIKNEDIIVFQSGYRTTDVANIGGEYAHRKIVEMFPKNKVLVFPQTINFKNKIEFEKSKNAYAKNKNVLFLARDKHSFSMAKETYVNDIKLYPDIVTSLIGKYYFENERKGFLCCTRHDEEKFYDNSDIEKMIEELKKVDCVDRNDTTIDITHDDLKKNLRDVIENMIEKFSKYKVVITDRYHGTIFSLISNTPTIVIGSTDHKLSSGVDWFRGIEEFDKYIFFANSLNEAKDLAIKIYNEDYDYTKKLPTYYDDKYYKKLKSIFI